MRAVLRRPDFRLLFAGMVASMIAESILLLALGVWVKDLTGSDGLAGATFFAIIAPMVLAPLVGWFVDRLRRRPFFVAVNIATAVILTPLFAVRERTDIWIIFVVAALYGLSYIALSATLNGLLKEIVPAELLVDANGALQTVKQGLRLIGPLLGAGLYTAFGGWTLAAVGAVGFLTAAAAGAAIRVRDAAPIPTEPRWLAEVGAGVRHIAGEPALRRVVTGAVLILIVLGFGETLYFAYVDQGLGRGPAFLGVLLSAQGIGGLVGGLGSSAVVRRLGEVGAVATGAGLFALGSLALVHPTLWLAVPAIVSTGLGLPVAVVGLNTLIQRRTPPHLLGRVSAASEALVSGPQAAAIGGGAVMVGLVDYRLLFLLLGVAMVGVAGYLWQGRRLSPPAPSAVPEPVAA
ncbi:MFS transporter [Micromonospora sp. NPDC049679]|uniref:MFS transporter n=1 Tax=Micromonospora sp. NPDC049679 TaxID=3155920 RepID=UPI00340BAB0F